MKKKLRVGVIFGGRSAEHEVSLLSAKNVIAALDKTKYEPVLIGIDKQGKWHAATGQKFLLNDTDPTHIQLGEQGNKLAVAPGEANQIVSQSSNQKLTPVDVVFPVLHGTFGEDGTVQGLLKLLDVPFVGPSVLGSAVGMDKDVAKRLWRDAGIPVADFVTVRSQDRKAWTFEKLKKKLGLPFFVKPANAGSSVGVSKVKSKKDFAKAMGEAFRFDTKVLVEEYIQGREIEVSVLGNEQPKASVPGEVKPTHEFYSYEAKYLDEHGAGLEIPAKLPKPVIKKIQDVAVRAFQVIECEGMARVDFFVRGSEVFVNEINTIPGFTKISMYPKLWEASGVSYGKLLDRLIQLAIQRHRRDAGLQTSFTK